MFGVGRVTVLREAAESTRAMCQPRGTPGTERPTEFFMRAIEVRDTQAKLRTPTVPRDRVVGLLQRGTQRQLRTVAAGFLQLRPGPAAVGTEEVDPLRGALPSLPIALTNKNRCMHVYISLQRLKLKIYTLSKKH